MFTNTGAPQGTVLSPFLFSLYTADCRSKHVNCLIDKYADDTALIGQLIDDDCSSFLSEISSFVEWCNLNFLELNVTKTKELIIDFRTNKSDVAPVIIKDSVVERVDSFRYLGVVFDTQLNWGDNTDALIKKVNSRMYCLRKLGSYSVSTHLLQMFYSSVICGVLTFGLTSWGGNLTKFDSDRIDKLINKAGRVIGGEQDSLSTLYKRRVNQKLKHITDDVTHPLWPVIDSLKIVRSGRFRIPRATTFRFLKSFVPSSVRFYKEQYVRGNVLDSI